MRFPHHASRKRKVGNGLYVRDPVCMVRNSHRPRENRIFGAEVDFRNLLDLSLGHTRFLDQIVPRMCLEGCFPCVDILTVGVQKVSVFAPQFQNPFCDSGQQRQVTSDIRLDIRARDFRPPQQAAWIAWDAKIDQTQFNRRIDDDHLTTTTANRF